MEFRNSSLGGTRARCIPTVVQADLASARVDSKIRSYSSLVLINPLIYVISLFLMDL